MNVVENERRLVKEMSYILLKNPKHDVLRHKLTFYENLPLDERQELLLTAKAITEGEKINYVVVADVDPQSQTPRLVVGGDTYPIKDIIKQAAKSLGGRAEYRPGLGWLVDGIKRSDLIIALRRHGVRAI